MKGQSEEKNNDGALCDVPTGTRPPVPVILRGNLLCLEGEICCI